MTVTPYVDGIIAAENLSESSKTQYLEKLATLTKVVGKPVDWIINNPHQVMAIVSKRYSCPLTQRAFVAAVKAVFHYNEDLKVSKAEEYQKYTDYQNQLSQAVTDRYMAAQPSDKERRNWVPWQDILEKEHHMACTEFGSHDHLLLAMYCLIEPLRQDYGALRILVDRVPPPEARGNYLAIASDGLWGKLVLNRYKTAKKYGTFERDLPPKLLTIIRENLVAYPRAYLFVDENGAPYKKSNSFTQFSNRTLKRLFGKNLTVSLMRHSHISSIDFNASTPGQLFEKSKNMAHSISMQQLYRRKVEPMPPEPPLQVIKQRRVHAPAPPPPPPAGVVTAINGERYVTLAL